ncbi:ATP-binding protein [Paludibacter sp. 221]|uniref:AAA family ATPase n=1 Tax=Paludibacter sp. 221 TaxID=2302939 RepID=UPI0013D75DC8|nr:AAA family ATPase [Paludibacter sp. 221]NDV45754.1 ATP-binding protein [Paludibacter sp. 221]
MEAFYRTHQYLVEHVSSPVKRLLMNEIDWSHRLIGIKGSRGVGKTTFLLQYAKERFGATDRSCLYINFNNFYFTAHTLVEFAEQFYRQGGRTLLLDQTFKYENWSKELRECYDRFPELHIVFSGSTVMRLIEDNEDLKDVVASYNLRGFSFREFIYLQTGKNFPAYTLEEIISNHEKIAREICSQVHPFDYFQDYLHHGYYPFFLEQRNFSENLVKTMNMMLEVDILLIKQIELKYLSKIRKLLYLLMTSAPAAPNVSQLSKDIETSRATIMNYIKYLQDARLLNLLYTEGEVFPKKPNRIYVHNTNLMYAVSPGGVDKGAEHRTFLYNALHAKHKVNMCRHHTDFCIDQYYHFKCEQKPQYAKYNPKVLYAVDDIEVGTKNEIPLWLLGFLY